jgi:hypothetical protein
MDKALRGAFALPICLAFLSGCTGDLWGEASVPPAGPPANGPAGSAESTGLKAIMKKIGAGQGALTATLFGQLNAEKPAWETIQPETKEYAQIAAEMVPRSPGASSARSSPPRPPIWTRPPRRATSPQLSQPTANSRPPAWPVTASTGARAPEDPRPGDRLQHEADIKGAGALSLCAGGPGS